MPQVFRVGEYWVYFWTDEGIPLEPIHVHVAKGKPVKNATKIWITGAGKCIIANNRSKIPEHTLRNIIRLIEARVEDVKKLWKQYFKIITYYC